MSTVHTHLTRVHFMENAFSLIPIRHQQLLLCGWTSFYWPGPGIYFAMLMSKFFQNFGHNQTGSPNIQELKICRTLLICHVPTSNENQTQIYLFSTSMSAVVAARLPQTERKNSIRIICCCCVAHFDHIFVIAFDLLQFRAYNMALSLLCVPCVFVNVIVRICFFFSDQLANAHVHGRFNRSMAIAQYVHSAQCVVIRFRI